MTDLLLNKEVPFYRYQNTALTNNDQIWTGGIAGLCNLERRRNKDMPSTDRILFQQLQMGLIDPCPQYNLPMDAATRSMRYLSEPLYSSAPNMLLSVY